MQTLETEPKTESSNNIADEVEDFLDSQEMGLEDSDSSERHGYTAELDDKIIGSRTPEDQASIELMLDNLEKKIEQIDSIRVELTDIKLDEISDPRLKEFVELLKRIYLAGEQAGVARAHDQERYKELSSRFEELDKRLTEKRQNLEKLQYERSSKAPSKLDMPAEASFFQKTRYRLSRKYRDSLHSDAVFKQDKKIADLNAEIETDDNEYKEVAEQLKGGSYRTNEKAVYNEFRQDIDSAKSFIEIELAKITEEAKEETDPAKKARLEAEIILITNEANKLESRIKSVNSGFERNVQKGHESIFSLHIDKPDTAALIGAETVDELVRKDLTPQFMGTVLDLLSKSLAKELKGFKDIHDTGASEFISSTLYTESSEVYGIDVPAELFRGPLTRPSEQLDCLLTDDELDRLSSLAGVMSKLYYPSEYVSPVELINTMIEGQRQARRFVEKFHSNSVVTHATTERGALAILRDGHLRSEVGVKSNSSHENNQIVANSAQGYIIENTTISFSVDDVESQFLETYNPDNEPIQERNGVIFARRTSEMCHDTAWFLMTNTQTTSRSEALELQVLDEDGVDIKEMDMFVSLEDFDYWTSQLEEIGYSTEWIKAHVHPIDFELDKYEQIVSELPKGATSSDESLPYKAGIYKDVRRRPRSSLLSSGTIKIDESAPEIVIPTTVYRL